MTALVPVVAAKNTDAIAGHQAEARRLARWGLFVLVGGLLPVLAWMTFAPLSSAVVAQGFVKVDLNRRSVQHAEGGTVREVKVRDGQHVRAGETLIVLGDVAVAADMNRLSYRVQAERASVARLDAEQRMDANPEFPREITTAARSDARLAELLVKERSLFRARRDGLTSQSALLRAQREKVEEEVVSSRAQIAAAQQSLQFQVNELEANRNLQKEGFLAATGVSQLEATVADYGARLEEKRSELARAEQRLLDTDIRLQSLESEYRQQASDQLKVTLARLSEIEQEQRKSEDAAMRQVIVAPADGEVISLRFTSPGTVIAPREPIADIVPSHPRLVVEARVRTEDVNRVTQDQPVDIRFTAFKYRTTKLVLGKVSYVSGDRLMDRDANQTYYSVLIDVDPASLAEVSNMQLLAGMPAEVYIKGETRTPLQYLFEPVTDVLLHAGRER